MENRKINFQPARLEYWDKILTSWRASNLSGAEFCRKHNLSTSAFYKWQRIFKNQKNINPTIAGKKELKHDFVPINLNHHNEEDKKHLNFKIKLPNGIEMEIQGPSNNLASLLKQLMEI